MNVVDLLALGDPRKHEHPMRDERYDELFLPGTPAVFAFHGYPSLVHQLTYRRNGHDDLHVHGFLERGTTTSPFDMLMRNEMDRFALAHDALTRVDAAAHEELLGTLSTARDAARTFAYTHGEDHPSVGGWEFTGWPQDEPAAGGTGGDAGTGETEEARAGSVRRPSPGQEGPGTGFLLHRPGGAQRCPQDRSRPTRGRSCRVRIPAWTSDWSAHPSRSRARSSRSLRSS